MADVLPPGIRTPEDIDKLPLPDYYKSMMKTYLANRAPVATPQAAPAAAPAVQDPTLGVPQYHGDPYTTAPVMITAKPPMAKVVPAGIKASTAGGEIKLPGVVMDKAQSIAMPQTYEDVDRGVKDGLIDPDKAYTLMQKIEKSKEGTDYESLRGYINKKYDKDSDYGPKTYPAREPAAPALGPVMDGPDTTEAPEVEEGLNPEDQPTGPQNSWGINDHDAGEESRLKELDRKSAGKGTGKYGNI